MNPTRRKFFGLGAAAVAAAAVPTGATEQVKQEITRPILLERICDAGRQEMTTEDIKEWERILIKEYGEIPVWQKGCGTPFQWYFGSGCYCPGCGRAYVFSLEMLKSGKYTVKQ